MYQNLLMIKTEIEKLMNEESIKSNKDKLKGP